MATGALIRAAAVAVLAVAAWTASHGGGAAADVARCAPQLQAPAGDGDLESRAVTLGKGKSIVCDFPRDIKDVLVADPKTANAVIRSLRRAYIIANATGATNIVFFDAEGRRMANFDIAVTLDVNVIRTTIRKLIPGADVNVDIIGNGIILTGSVANQAEAQQAYDIASNFVDTGESFSSGGTFAGGSTASGVGASVQTGLSQYASNSSGGSGAGAGGSSKVKVVNAIVVRGRDQVMLKVTVAEMDRTVIKQLGINLNGSAGFGSAVLNFNNNAANPSIATGYSPPVFPINGTPSNTFAVGSKGLTATLQAMEQVGVVRTLAEPTLTAISGEAAHFLVGGTFPYPVPAALGQPPAVQFQNYGVGLNFTPVVLSEGRISLHVASEVSQLDPTTSVTIAGTTVPGLTVRRTDTTVEIPSGGTLAMAGMLQEQTKQTITGLPGLMQLPILGVLFKSNDYLNSRTELVALVTPYVVHAVAQKDLSRPDDGFADPSDPAAVLLGRLNRIYGVGGIPDPPENYRGKYGFILD